MKNKKLRGMLFLMVAIILMSSTVSASPVLENNTEPYIEITPVNENYYKDILKKEKSDENIRLTYDEVLRLYEEYIAQTPQLQDVTSSEMYTKETLDNFAQYAVERGIIEDTLYARQSITVTFLRAQFRIAADIGESLGYSNAANFLRHSLQDNPTNVSFAVGTVESDWIKDSVEYEEIFDDFKDYVAEKDLRARTTSGSTTLNSTSDLHLALNKVEYIASGTKSSSDVWTLTITFKDTYDFEEAPWGDMGGELVTIVNNYAALAEDLGAIVPYDINIKVRDTFTE